MARLAKLASDAERVAQLYRELLRHAHGTAVTVGRSSGRVSELFELLIGAAADNADTAMEEVVFWHGKLRELLVDTFDNALPDPKRDKGGVS